MSSYCHFHPRGDPDLTIIKGDTSEKRQSAAKQLLSFEEKDALQISLTASLLTVSVHKLLEVRYTDRRHVYYLEIIVY